MTGVLLLAVQIAAGGDWRGGCTEQELLDIAAAAAAALRGAEIPTSDASGARGVQPQPTCDVGVLARTAERGWREARRLAPLGGDPTLLGGVTPSIDELEGLKRGPLAVEAEYAQAAIRAAIAAAQDERPEMELFLAHARDLSERLSQRGRRATWPRSFNLLAGELWLEVDRYEEARQAFERAVSVEASPLALVGLGESLERLGRHDEACAALQRVTGAAGTLLAAAERLRAACP